MLTLPLRLSSELLTFPYPKLLVYLVAFSVPLAEKPGCSDQLLPGNYRIRPRPRCRVVHLWEYTLARGKQAGSGFKSLS